MISQHKGLEAMSYGSWQCLKERYTTEWLYNFDSLLPRKVMGKALGPIGNREKA